MTPSVEEGSGQFTPVTALADEAQQPVDRRTVATVEVVVLGEGLRQGVLVDAAVGCQDGDHGAGHLRVVGPLPEIRGQFAALEKRVVGGDEEL